MPARSMVLLEQTRWYGTPKALHGSKAPSQAEYEAN